ncbi:AAA family ATPase [Pasteurella multocida]|uniref:AAA family ATPase n=1 Tax=Pasteurella multocida TaxID=747 RepID=UPI002B49ECF6|nr:AAA family ATPase [Pasteurella multocida]WRK02796.1 AAA family ATPase [Pasteurella multocida]HDR1799011.1 AAA family ATPase [Pasteurella multocida]
MKIAIYGVSRSGKDYLIERVVEYLKTQNISALHIKGSATLNALSKQKYGMQFKDINEEQKIVLREKFIKEVDESTLYHDVVFVDGHYAFITENGFDIVFTEADKYCYDHFFYLDTLTEKIIEFSRANPKTKLDLNISFNAINRWKNFEKQELTEICNQLEKELVILDEDTEICIQFLSYWIKEYRTRFNYRVIAKNVVETFINSTQHKHTKVILIDCDNTISENDITYDFCNFLGIDKTDLKKIFFGDRYSSYQFFKIKRLYQSADKNKTNAAIDFAKSKILINSAISNFINNRENDSYAIALTVGLLEVWKKVLSNGNINALLGNSINLEQDFFVTPLLKKYIAYAFKSQGLEVLSIGDSIIDIPMLEISDYGYIVAHRKINSAVLAYFKQNPNSKIMQIFAEKWHYPIKQRN